MKKQKEEYTTISLKELNRLYKEIEDLTSTITDIQREMIEEIDHIHEQLMKNPIRRGEPEFSWWDCCNMWRERLIDSLQSPAKEEGEVTNSKS